MVKKVKKLKVTPMSKAARDRVIDECVRCVPTNWCDSLLTGPNKVGDMPGRETEQLLLKIIERIRALKTPPVH